MGLASGPAAFSTLLQMKAEGDAADAKIQQDQVNQQLSEARAGDALQRGAIVAARLRMRGGQVVAQQRAGYASSGVDANVGSAAQVQSATRGMSELDAQTAMNNAARQAWGFKTYGAMYGQEAEYEKRAGKYAQTGTLLGGIGGLAGMAGKLAGGF